MKQGFLAKDDIEGAPAELMMVDLLRDPTLKLSKKDFNMGQGEYFCMNPEFLAYQLKQSLSRLGVETIDLVMLQNPYE